MIASDHHVRLATAKSARYRQSVSFHSRKNMKKEITFRSKKEETNFKEELAKKIIEGEAESSEGEAAASEEVEDPTIDWLRLGANDD